MEAKTSCTCCKKLMLQLRTSNMNCKNCHEHLFKDDETVEQVADIVHSSVCVGRGSAPRVTATLTGASGDAKVETANTAVNMTVINTSKGDKKKDSVDDDIESMEDDINCFENLIKRKREFFKCQTLKSVQQVIKSLENKRWVIITGFPREGKTTLAANAADWFIGREVDHGFYYKNASSYRKPKGNYKNSITIIDDKFEENDESQCLLRDIEKDLSSKESTNLYVIVCQLYNLKRARRYITSYLLDDKHVVNVSDINSQCTGSELERLFKAVNLSSTQVHQITNGEYILGLPGICLYYNSNRHFPKDVTFFSYPHSFFKDLIMTICKSDPKKRATFIMLLVSCGEIDIRETRNDKFKKLMQVICKYFFDSSISCEDISNEIEHLIGTFFKVSKTHIISFRYQVMYDACVVAVDRLYPGNLWKECRLHCIHSDQMHNSSIGGIFLTKSNITVIVENFMQQLEEKHFKDVLTNYMLREKQIMEKLHEKMKLSFPSLLLGSDCEHGGTLMFWCLKSANIPLQDKVMDPEDTNLPEIITSAISSCIESKSDELLQMVMTKYIPKDNLDTFLNFKDNNGNTPLMKASIDGSVCIAKVLLEFGADPKANDNNEQNCVHKVSINDHLGLYSYLENYLPDELFHQEDVEGFTPFQLACKKRGNIFAHYRNKLGIEDDGKQINKKTSSPGFYWKGRHYSMDGLIDLSAKLSCDLSISSEDHDTILNVASFYGCCEVVEVLLHLINVNLNIKGKYGRTPVMNAAMRGHIKVLKILVQKGADISIKDIMDRTVLHLVCCTSNAECVSYVVHQKKDYIHAKDEYGRTPLMYAAQLGCRIVFDLLLGQGADISVLDHDNGNVLHRACFKDNADFVQYLVCEKRLDVHARDKYGKTPLMYAAQFGCRSVFDLLLGQGADISVLDHDNRNVLHRACYKDNAKFVQYLVCEKRLDVYTRDKDGQTPLMYAAEFGCRSVFDLLLGQGADISVFDQNNSNVLHRACCKDNADFVQYLVCETRFDIHTRNKYGKTPLMFAAQFGCRIVFDLLLGQGADISVLDQNNSNVLHQACFEDNAKFVQYLVCEKRLDVHTRNKDGQTPLIYAAQNGCRSVFDLLLCQGADISVLDHDNSNVLHQACCKDNAKFVQYLVCEKRFDVHTRNKYGRTPLMYAAEFGYRSVFDLLLGQGADISVLDNDNGNVLHRACFKDNADFVQYLVCEKRLDVHTRNKDGQTPLIYAAQNGCGSVFDLLLGGGADISILDHDNSNVLHRACCKDNAKFVQYLVCEKRFDVHTRDKYGKTPLMYAAQFGCRNVFDLLLGIGADISVLDNDNGNVLHRACFNDIAEFVQYLVCEKRFDVHTRDKYRKTPLIYAVQFGCRNVFDLLLGGGADISIRDHDNSNVLHRACCKDNAKFVQYLVCEKRFDVHSTDKNGRTPLMFAAQFGCRNVFDLLLGEGADISILDHDNSNVLHRACCKDNAKFVQYLVCEKRFDVHTRDKYGKTPLMYAAQFGCRNVFDLLLGIGADISVLDHNKGNVLHRGCCKDNAEFVQYLVREKRLDVYARDKYGRTPLMYAAQNGCRNIFDLLVGEGADISVLGHDKDNVLHRACYNDNTQFVKYIVREKRFDVHARDKYGRTPLMYAAQNGCRNVFDLFLGEGADISVLDHDKSNVLHVVCFMDNAEFVQYLIREKRLDVHTRDIYWRTPLMYASEFGCRIVFDLLLGEGADISVLDHDKSTVLHRACCKDNAEFVKYLVCEKGFGVHTRDKYGRTPLIYAAGFGCRKVFDLLQGEGADISVLDHDKSNVLHVACSTDNIQFVQYLVREKRFDIHARDKYGRTPLMYAAQFGCRKVFDLLLGEGADISVIDHANKNVLHQACCKNNAEFVKYLVREKRFEVHTKDNKGRTPLMYAAKNGCRKVLAFLKSQAKVKQEPI